MREEHARFACFFSDRTSVSFLMESGPTSKKRSGSLNEQDSYLQSKKSKTSNAEQVIKNPVTASSVLNKRFFSLPDSEILKSYQDAKPFQHVSIENVINEDLFEEIKQFLPKADWIKKKNDLYTFNQTKDLASFSEVFSSYFPYFCFSLLFILYVRQSFDV